MHPHTARTNPMHHTTTHSNTVTTIVTTLPDGRQTTTVRHGAPREYGKFKRGLIMSILTATAFVLWLIAMTTPIAVSKYESTNSNSSSSTGITNSKVTVDPWHSCGPNGESSLNFCRPMGHDDETCERSRDMFRVEQSFLILTGLMLLPLLCLAALDFSHKLDARTPDLPFHLGTHWWMLLFACLVALMSLIAFAVAFAIGRMDRCGSGALVDAPRFHWGPSPFFSLLIFLFALAMIILALILRRDASVKSREEMGQPHSPIINPHEPLAVHTNSVVPGTQTNRQNEAVVRPIQPAHI